MDDEIGLALASKSRFVWRFLLITELEVERRHVKHWKHDGCVDFTGPC